jgi:signal peptidase II
MKKFIWFGAIALIVLGLDLFTKALVMESLPVGHGIKVIPGLLDLVHVRNRGVAFGLLSTSPITRILPYLNLLVLVALAVFLLKGASKGNREPVLAGLICGGALGNLLDRWRYGAVVDFLDFYWGKYHWPAFNLADASITLGIAVLALSFLTHARMGDKGK